MASDFTIPDSARAERVPLADGEAFPETATRAAIYGRMRAWPASLLARLSLARRLARGHGLTAGEAEQVARRQAIAAGRDIGSHAEAYVDESDTITIDPPHRGIGRLLLLRELSGPRLRGLSEALTGASRRTEAVQMQQKRVERATERRSAREKVMPDRPAGWQVAGWLIFVLGVGVAAVEGAVTHPLWTEVLGDKRFGVIFAVVFACVLTAAVHLLAVWVWQLAGEHRRLREVTLGIVVAMVVTALGLVIVSGIERDRVLISNRVASAERKSTAREGAANGAALISSAIPSAAGTTPTTSAGAAAPAPAGGLLGAAAAPQTTTATPPPTAGSLTAAGAGMAAPGSAAAISAAGAARRDDGHSIDDVSFTFIAWLNVLLLLAVPLYTRSHVLGAEWRDACDELRDLGHAEDVARGKLGRAEEARQRAYVNHDYHERVLLPLVDRMEAEEAALDRLFVDQLQRSALAALGRPVTVVLKSQPEELDGVLRDVLPEDLATHVPAEVRLGAVPYDPNAVTEALAGDGHWEPPTKPASAFGPTSSSEPDSATATGDAEPSAPTADAPTVSPRTEPALDGDPLDPDEGVTTSALADVDAVPPYPRDIV
jgi:hypothetical protein